ncbi:MAG: hypothetical protein WCC06_11495 [Candidatus Aminicenantales bacterium]
MGPMLRLRHPHGPERRILWVATLVSQPWVKIAPEEIGWSAVFKCNLKTGTLIKKHEFGDRGAGHLLNDLTLTRSGDVFLTDSIRCAIYAIFHDAGHSFLLRN